MVLTTINWNQSYIIMMCEFMYITNNNNNNKEQNLILII